MLLRNTATLLATASFAYALRDATPFFLLSTEALDQTSLQSQQLSTNTHIEGGLEPTLSTCGSSVYIFVEHPGLHAVDLRHDAMPKMRRRLGREEYKSIVQIPEVVGEINMQRVVDALSRNCGGPKMSVQEYQSSPTRPYHAVLHISNPPVPSSGPYDIRSQSLVKSDAHVDSQLHSVLANHTSHTIIYIGVPASEQQESSLDYEKEDEPPFHSGMHTDLKRDMQSAGSRRKAEKSKNPQDGLPLFEKYQFLSPGIFMGLVVALLLFIILYVGVSAIAGLEVSYMAFSKEMGHGAQKKQQ